MKNLIIALSIILGLYSCAQPKMAVTAKLEGKVEAPRNQDELNDVRLAMYVSEYISAHGKVFADSDYKTYNFKFLVFDAKSLVLQNVDDAASPAMTKYFKRLFSQKGFKPPLNGNYKLGETITIKVKLEHN